jgi:hypothetical protein
MARGKKVIHPVTNEEFTLAEWAEIYIIPRTSLKGWVNQFDLNKVFKALDRGLTPSGVSLNSWIDPNTNEINTIAVWAEKVNRSPREIFSDICNKKIDLQRAKVFQGAISLRNPNTGEIKRLKYWAENYFGIPLSTLRSRAEKHSPEELFEGKIQSPNEKRIINPATRESLYLDQWALRLEITPKEFKKRLLMLDRKHPLMFTVGQIRLKSSDIPSQGLTSPEAIQVKLKIAQKNNALLCTNPRTKESKLACDWANYYRVSVHEFYQYMKKLGRNNPELYQHFDRQRQRNRRVA